MSNSNQVSSYNLSAFFNLLLFCKSSVVCLSGVDHSLVFGPPKCTEHRTDSDTDTDVDDDLSLHGTCNWSNSHCVDAVVVVVWRQRWCTPSKALARYVQNSSPAPGPVALSPLSRPHPCTASRPPRWPITARARRDHRPHRHRSRPMWRSCLQKLSYTQSKREKKRRKHHTSATSPPSWACFLLSSTYTTHNVRKSLLQILRQTILRFHQTTFRFSLPRRCIQQLTIQGQGQKSSIRRSTFNLLDLRCRYSILRCLRPTKESW